jgi:TFIIH basal transcription factor complex TTD-A subunit
MPTSQNPLNPGEAKRSQTNTIRRIPGVLIECDPSVKAIILKYDEERHDYIVEDLDDDRHLVIKESQLQNLKIRLGRVSGPLIAGWMDDVWMGEVEEA